MSDSLLSQRPGVALIKYVLESFDRMDPSAPVKLVELKDTELHLDITVRNGVSRSETLKRLRRFFGEQLELKIDPISGKQELLIRVSKAIMPESGYAFTDILAYWKERAERGFFLGVSRSVEEDWWLPLGSTARHIGISGTSGSGKSNFLRNLLTQALTQWDTVVSIIDPKGDYFAYRNHPRLGVYAPSYDEYLSLFQALFLEINYRQLVYSASFEVPPASLDEYWELREKHGRKDLPRFPRLMILIDEAHQVIGSFDYSNHLDLIYTLLRKARSFGVVFCFASQRANDLPPTIGSQCGTVVRFHSPDGSTSAVHEALFRGAEDHVRSHPGSFQVFNPSRGVPTSGKAPLISTHDSLIIARALSEGLQLHSNHGFSRLTIHRELLESGALFRLLVEGHTIQSLLTQRPLMGAQQHGRKGYRFTLSHLHELIEPATPSDIDERHADSEVIARDMEKLTRKRFPHRALEVLIPQKTDNSTPERSMKVEYEALMARSPKTLSWLKVANFEENAGVAALRRYFSDADQNDPGELEIEELALDDEQRERLSAFVSSVRKAQEARTPSPALVISGPGKGTILKAIASSLEGGTVAPGAAPEDSLRLRFVIHDSLDSFKLHGGSCPQSEIPVYLLKSLRMDEGLFFLPPADPLEGISGLQFDFTHLRLSKEMYRSPDVGISLLRSLLRRRGYGDQVTRETLELFVRSGVPSKPGAYDAVISRAAAAAARGREIFAVSHLQGQLKLHAADRSPLPEGAILSTPALTFDDLVLPPEISRKVQSVIFWSQAENGAYEFEFARKLRPSGRRMCIAMNGPPGCGKTALAGAIARATGRKFLTADLAALFSCFLGQTDKNLTKIFEAGTGHVLFFDEADSLLHASHRSGGAPDHMRRILNHMLGLIEGFQGILIFASNHGGEFDGALDRRIDLKLNFPSEYTREQQVRVLETLLRPDAPLEPGVDLHRILEGVSLSPGLLRNAVERAFLIMLQDGSGLMSAQVLRTAIRETAAESQVVASNRKRMGIDMP